MPDSRLPQGLHFKKMHGAGNDFVIIDSRGGPARVHEPLARALGDRHRGVGFDQLAELHGGGAEPLRLDFWNRDGTRAGACGNATRCVAHLVMSESGADGVVLVTARGALAARRDAAGRVSVNMGPPQLDWRDIPLLQAADIDALPLDGAPSAVGMGNPHCVNFVEDAEAVELERLGPALEHDPLFPERANVEFVSVSGPDALRVRVWERGAGVTLACGSGACAVAVAAHRRGLTGRRVSLTLDGGVLEVDWLDDGVWLSGPVSYVFDGSVAAAIPEAI